MTPDVVVDVGNSRMKWGRVSGGRVAEVAAFDHDDAVGWKRQCELWELSPAVCELASMVAPDRALRTLDALHLATFLIARRRLEGITLLTADERLRQAADSS